LLYSFPTANAEIAKKDHPKTVSLVDESKKTKNIKVNLFDEKDADG